MENRKGESPMPVFDLHCDTLTAFMSPLRCRDTLNDPCSAFALSKVQTIPWCQCCAVFVPDGLTPQEALSYYRYHRDSFQRQVQGCQGQALACTTAREVSAAWEQGKTALVLTVENGSLLGAGLEHGGAASGRGTDAYPHLERGECPGLRP